MSTGEIRETARFVQKEIITTRSECTAALAISIILFIGSTAAFSYLFHQLSFSDPYTLFSLGMMPASLILLTFSYVKRKTLTLVDAPIIHDFPSRNSGIDNDSFYMFLPACTPHFKKWLVENAPSNKRELFNHTILKENFDKDDVEFFQTKGTSSFDFTQFIQSKPIDKKVEVVIELRFYQYNDPNGTYIDFAHPTRFGSSFRERGNVQEQTMFCEFRTLARMAYAFDLNNRNFCCTDNNEPAPFFVRNITRNSVISSKLYGSKLYSASPDEIAQNVSTPTKQVKVTIGGMAAKSWGGSIVKRYTKEDILYHFKTAYLCFSAAQKLNSKCVIHTGAWGCGVFGNSFHMMALLQIAAARLAGIQEIVFHGEKDRSRLDIVQRELARCKTYDQLVDYAVALQNSSESELWLPK